MSLTTPTSSVSRVSSWETLWLKNEGVEREREGERE